MPIDLSMCLCSTNSLNITERHLQKNPCYEEDQILYPDSAVPTWLVLEACISVSSHSPGKRVAPILCNSVRVSRVLLHDLVR